MNIELMREQIPQPKQGLSGPHPRALPRSQISTLIRTFSCFLNQKITCKVLNYKKYLFINTIFFLCILFFIPTPGHSDENIGYRIGSGDILEISVWKEESLNREVIVPPDLTIAFPLIGEIEVKEMTVGGLRREVTKRLEDYIPEATVTVMLRQINSLRAYVIGKVNKPGQFPIDLDTTTMQLLAMAGGLNPFAAAGKIYILRHQDGKMIKIPFDYRDLEKGRNLTQNITIQRGDVIIVP